MQPQTPEQALNLLNQAVGQLTVNRDTHAQLQQAVITLQEAIKPKEEDATIKEK